MTPEIKQKMEYYQQELKLKFGKPMQKAEIQELEAKLEVKISSEYRDFLQTYGCVYGGLGGDTVDILGSVFPKEKDDKLSTGEYLYTALGMTLDGRRSSLKPPADTVILNVDGAGGYYCLVCKGKDNGRVIYWDSYCRPEQAYPNNPTEEWFAKHPNWTEMHVTKQKEDFWVEALDFWGYLFRIFGEARE